MWKFFEGLVPALPDKPVTQPPSGLWAFCRHYTKGYEGPLVLMSILMACIAALEVMLFGFMGQLVDWLVTKDPQTFMSEEGVRLFGMGALVLVGLPVLFYIHSSIVHQTLLGNYPMSIRWLAHRYLLKQSLSFYQNDFAGRVATKVMQTSLAVRESVMKMLNVMVYIFVYFTSLVILIGTADAYLVLPLLGWLFFYVALQLYFVPRLKRVSTEQADARSLMTGRIVDSYTNISTVKLFAHTQQEEDYAKDSMKVFLDTVYRQMRLVTGLNVGVQFSNYLLVFAMSFLAIYLWTQSLVTAGSIAVAISLVLRLNGMSQWVMWEVSSLFEQIGTVADGAATLAKPIEVEDVAEAPLLNVTQGAIDFRQVDFQYDKKGARGGKVFNGLDLSIKPGEKVGVVGRSGAGKSTLVNLLLRFYDLDGGGIDIDGQDICRVQQESLRASIGMVTQDTSLLHRSVRENILYGNPSASESELLAAVQKAHAAEFIEQLTDPQGNVGFDAQVGERGVKLSGGQRQRIAIARVLLKNAPILVLDEATSALDSEVEVAIQDNLYQLMKGKTVIAIAHRLSTIAAMDRLIVLDEGGIAEQGTHAELVEKGGIYAQLWAHQTGGFIGLD